VTAGSAVAGAISEVLAHSEAIAGRYAHVGSAYDRPPSRSHRRRNRTRT